MDSKVQNVEGVEFLARHFRGVRISNELNSNQVLRSILHGRYQSCGWIKFGLFGFLYYSSVLRKEHVCQPFHSFFVSELMLSVSFIASLRLYSPQELISGGLLQTLARSKLRVGAFSPGSWSIVGLAFTHIPLLTFIDYLTY